MLTDHSRSNAGMEGALSELNRLRRFSGAPAEFWPAFIAAAGQLIGATRGILVLRDPAAPERLKKLSDWSSNGHADRSIMTFTRMLPQLVQNCSQTGSLAQAIETGAAPNTKHFALAINIPIPTGSGETCIGVFLLLNATDQQADEALWRLKLAADTPAAYRLNHEVTQARHDVEKFASVLDIAVQVNAEKRFLAASLAFCNALASRYNCDRVSLGWLERGYIRLRTISRTERFDKHMAAVQAIEVIMEECFDQDEEIILPPVDGSSAVSKDHERFAKEQQSGHLCSLPLRVEHKPVAVLTCERAAAPFSPAEIQQLRLACDQNIRRLSELKQHDRWFGARFAAWTREKLSKVLGPEHTWAKVLALVGVLAMVLLILPIYPYRVEGNFILRTDDVSFLTAPFEGYIEQVALRPGDPVQAGGVLLQLDTNHLQLEEMIAIAEQNRFLREAEKARAANSLAEMRIAQASADQARARLDLIRYRIGQAAIKAPYDGVLVEGDLRQRIGAPVKQGEALFKVARLSTLYIEAEINERDVNEILDRSSGEIAFVTQPKLKFPISIERIEPAAFPKEGQNVFLVRCDLSSDPEPWWRPGMSGVVKLDVERRTLLWIATHRTMDFLRMLLWW
jgi:multidrug resistance efflux pump